MELVIRRNIIHINIKMLIIPVARGTSFKVNTRVSCTEGVTQMCLVSVLSSKFSIMTSEPICALSQKPVLSDLFYQIRLLTPYKS